MQVEGYLYIVVFQGTKLSHVNISKFHVKKISVLIIIKYEEKILCV